jgi:hypothetical protein
LIPSPEGITAVLSVDGEVTAQEPVNPQQDDAASLARRWLIAS